MARRNRELRELRLGLAGQRVFFVAILAAIALGVIAPGHKLVTSSLVILGLLIGVLNITQKEVTNFLLASLVLMLGVNTLYILPLVGVYVRGVFDYILYLVTPAAVIVALIAFWKLASTR